MDDMKDVLNGVGDAVASEGRAKGLSKYKNGGRLAEGEKTGHVHEIRADVEIAENGVRTFAIQTPKTVRHQEHKPVTLVPGDYASDRVVEYDEDQEEHRVAD